MAVPRAPCSRHHWHASNAWHSTCGPQCRAAARFRRVTHARTRLWEPAVEIVHDDGSNQRLAQPRGQHHQRVGARGRPRHRPLVRARRLAVAAKRVEPGAVCTRVGCRQGVHASSARTARATRFVLLLGMVCMVCSVCMVCMRMCTQGKWQVLRRLQTSTRGSPALAASSKSRQHTCACEPSAARAARTVQRPGAGGGRARPQSCLPRSAAAWRCPGWRCRCACRRA